MLFSLLTLFLVFAQAKMNFVLDNKSWYCLKFPAEGNTVLDMQYHVEGVNRDQVVFEAKQN